MRAKVQFGSMGRITVTTIDKYGNTRNYRFNANSGAATPQDGYTPVVLKALWDEGVPVDWSPDELTASQRAQIDGFCSECGSKLNHQQVGRDDYETWCGECDKNPAEVA